MSMSIGSAERQSASFPRLEAFVRRTPLLSVRDAREGPLAAEGRALASATMSSPISGVEVIGFRVLIEAEIEGGRMALFDVARCYDFALADASGRIDVKASKHAVLLFAHEYSSSSAEIGSATFDVERLMVDDARWRAHSPTHFRWHEYLLQAGESIYVAGECTLLLDPSASPQGYREAARRPTLRGGSEQPLLLTDRTHQELLVDLENLAREG